MKGYRTVVAAAVAVLSNLLLLAGVNFDELLRAHGVDPAQLVDHINGVVNLLVALSSAAAAIYFRIAATRRVLTEEKLK